jgi:alpha-ketoglutarate-dependent taurine dioxygenase
VPFPLPSRAAPGPRRRTLFASAAGAVLLVGCSAEPGGSGGRGASAEERARAGAARDSERLVARYDAVGAAHPGLVARLRPLRAEVVRHARAFGGSAPATASASDSATSLPSATDAPSGSSSGAPAARDTVPADPAAALAALAGAEKSLADRRTAALAGLPGETARLLASVAAAGAAHAYLLRTWKPEPDTESDSGASGGEERE